MSDRWDYIEKEMDLKFSKRIEHDKKTLNAYSDYINLAYRRNDDNKLQFTNDSLDYVRYRNKLRFHNIHKFFRKLWFKIFNF